MNNTFSLAPRQMQVLAAVASSLATRGHAPTYADIKRMTGIGGNRQITACLIVLQQRGLVRMAGKGRGAPSLTSGGMALALNQEPCAHCHGTGRQDIARKASA